MKVTKREQVLIGVLLIVLLCYGFYNFVFLKQSQNIAELKASRDAYSQKWDQAKAKITSENEIKEQYKNLNSKIFNATGMLFPSLEQEKIIVILDKMIKDSNLQAYVLAFSEVSSGNNFVDTTKTVNNEDKTKNTTNKLDKLVNDFNGTSKNETNSKKTNDSKIIGAYKMEVTLKFNGVYDELINFIAQVEDYDKKIIIKSITLTGAEGSEVSGNITLEFYGVPKLNNNDDFKWNYKKPNGSENPFFQSPTTSPTNNEITAKNGDKTVAKDENTVANDNSKSDFVLYAKPKTADLHTVTIEKGKDESKLSYIYVDNAGVELVEFYFTQIGTKYFYKYKTSKGTYPKDFSKPIEFVPTGKNIALDIFSQKRGLGSDLSGVNINITNDTDKKVDVDILDDDKNKPRVKILKQIGDISVVRNYIQYVNK
ncbi:hypothetical protein [Clostridium estertheticum]|uniref:Type IV pilus assembly protein PilO n=1 Tax=Clostridium estertheticum subsp. estertheticum TaxID=1552 RepID=A0A1J0GKL9_9CLOT|nr:hypothetical protein [Clostridium estertheticum]APC41496.1 hypothetical protein A7L45_16125 [Clostridium estertheticum subsp. estertheticum]MBZ9616595.1 hypothetical protein [Clostridium estertheticum subsp. laramiense]WAG72318.1 hypothetical protein LL032_14220 [Clostridium estertheticum]